MSMDETIRIVLVEDNEHDANAFKRTLKRAENISVKLTRYERAEKALAALTSREMDCSLVAFDFNLPGIDGLEAGEMLLKHRPDLPLLLLTGEGSELLAVKAMHSGFSDYIVKDVKGGYLNLLPAKIEEVIKRSKRERDYREAQERYTRLVEESPEIFYTFSSTRGCLFASSRLEYILGYSTKALSDYPDLWSNFIHEQDQDQVCAAMDNISKGTHYYLEYRIKTVDGQWKWLRDRSIGFSVKNDETIVSGVATDITKEKNLAYLKENFEIITRHDLRSPLSGIIGLAGILVEEVEDHQRAMVSEIERAAQSMMGMLERMMDLYKLENGLFELDLTHVDVDELMQSVIDLLRRNPSFQEHNIHFSPCLMSITTDRELLSTILTNLLKNALEAGSVDDPVHLNCLAEGEKLVIEVHNDQEVDQEIRPIFFEKFYTKGKRSGTGIGTFSSKLMTEKLGGSIAMTSSAESGTTIRVTLRK